ncbi:MAG: hypothetical protein KJ789_06625, partial [Alphaproteobacteria bacterium]|nr:hypothetical protein [Alphaproteobacteria bacterium]
LDGGFAIAAVPGKATPRVRLGTLALKPLPRDVAVQNEAVTGEGNGARGPPGAPPDGEAALVDSTILPGVI